jgi:hypothetical protein
MGRDRVEGGTAAREHALGSLEQARGHKCRQGEERTGERKRGTFTDHWLCTDEQPGTRERPLGVARFWAREGLEVRGDR